MWALLIICMIAVICIVALSIIKTKKYLFFLIPVMLGFLFSVNVMMSLGAGAALSSIWPTIQAGLLVCLAAALIICGGLWIYQFGLRRPEKAAAAEQAKAEPAAEISTIEEPAEEVAEEVIAEADAQQDEPAEIEPAEEVAEEVIAEADAQQQEPAEIEPAEEVAEEVTAEADAQQDEPAEIEPAEEVAEEAIAEADAQQNEPAEEDAEPEEGIQLGTEPEPEPKPEPEPEPQDPRLAALAKARELAAKGVVTLASGLYRQAMQHDEYDETCRTAGRELLVFLIDSKKYDAARAHARAAIDDPRLSDAERKWYGIILRRIGA